jgi:hypothetical protein
MRRLALLRAVKEVRDVRISRYRGVEDVVKTHKTEA